jgi:Holliday junction resolvase RusA-like endonuclease
MTPTKTWKSIEFVVPGPPRGKGRHRMTRTGHSYTPQDTMMYENLIKSSFLSSFPPNGGYEDRITLTVVAFFAIPKSASKKKKVDMACAMIQPTKKPDVDNILKVVCDALNGVAWKDDAQITEAFVYKEYDENPHLTVSIDYLVDAEEV